MEFNTENVIDVDGIYDWIFQYDIIPRNSYFHLVILEIITIRINYRIHYSNI